jgi:hypothetical protein
MKICTLLVLVSFLLLGPQKNLDTITFSNGDHCGMTGNAKGSQAKDLNRHKNRWKIPATLPIDPQVTLTTMLAPGDDEGRFDQEKAAKITGFVINVKVGGNESCNCNETKPVDRDTHIELALAPGAPEIQRVIVEVTPRLRQEIGSKWTTSALQTSIKGKWVEISGWMLFDTMHLHEAENTNPGGARNWRATCWEIHPVTKITVLSGPPSSAPNNPQPFLAEMQRAHAQHVRRDPKKKSSIQQRNAQALSKFNKTELDKELP